MSNPSPEVMKLAREAQWLEVKALARKAIYADGRGMIGRERNYLEDRIARALTADRAASKARIEELERALKEAQAANERDRTEVCIAVNSLTDAFSRRDWLIRGGRGSYEWDDDRFRDEFRDAMQEFAPHVDRLRKIGADRKHCPETQAEVIAARTGYTTVDPSEGEQAKPCYPDPVMDAVRRCAEIARRDVDWTSFARRSKPDWRSGTETNIFAAPRDPDDTMPTDANVFAYKIGLAAGQVIAAAILREFGLLPTSET